MIERDSGSVVGTSPSRGRQTTRAESKWATASFLTAAVAVTRRRRRAARALIDWAPSQPKVRVLVTGCKPDNVPSIRTLERVGFHRSGEADGEIRWRYGSYSGEV